MNFSIFVRKVFRKILGREPSIAELRARGVTIGENCHIFGGIDYGHGYLITIGNNVTLASSSLLLSHDGSTKKILGYSKVGRIDIGDDVFIGAGSIVLPNVKIGSRVVVGAGSIITKDIPDNSVVAGNPAKVIGSYDDYVAKNTALFETALVQDTSYTKKSAEEKQQMKQYLLDHDYGFDD